MRKRLVLPGLSLIAGLLITPVAQAKDLTVFAAASLTNALNIAGAAWTRQGNPAVHFSFASSSTLARQIAAGAHAQIFASADEGWMDWLEKRHLIIAKTRRDLLSNTLVLIMPTATAHKVVLRRGFDLPRLLGPEGRLAVGDPTNVPVGIYAKAALKSLGAWNYAKHHLAPTIDVREGLLMVEHCDAPAGIVYATDARVTAGVKVVGTFPAASHPPIAYPFAITKGGNTKPARAFLAFLESRAGRAIFASQGFVVLK